MTFLFYKAANGQYFEDPHRRRLLPVVELLCIKTHWYFNNLPYRTAGIDHFVDDELRVAGKHLRGAKQPGIICIPKLFGIDGDVFTMKGGDQLAVDRLHVSKICDNLCCCAEMAM